MKVRDGSDLLSNSFHDEEVEIMEKADVAITTYLNKNAWKLTLACFLSLGM